MTSDAVQTFRADRTSIEPAPRLLLVDDDDSVRLTMAAVLAKEGYDVTAAPDGASAVAQLREHEFDVVVSDLRLGDMDGLGVLSEARQRNPEIITVVLTGYGSMESAIDAIRQGVFGYIVKPCKIDEMKATIRTGLERQRAQQVSRQAEMAKAAAEAREQLSRELEAQKGNWLAAISHDLKGPLTTIKGTVQWLRRKDKFRDEQRLMAAFETINLAASRMARMLDELGDIGRAEGARRPLRRHPGRRAAAHLRPVLSGDQREPHSGNGHRPDRCTPDSGRTRSHDQCREHGGQRQHLHGAFPAAPGVPAAPPGTPLTA
jgi:DNA-binding response OmpR family regulator